MVNTSEFVAFIAITEAITDALKHIRLSVHCKFILKALMVLTSLM